MFHSISGMTPQGFPIASSTKQAGRGQGVSSLEKARRYWKPSSRARASSASSGTAGSSKKKSVEQRSNGTWTSPASTALKRSSSSPADGGPGSSPTPSGSANPRVYNVLCLVVIPAGRKRGSMKFLGILENP